MTVALHRKDDIGSAYLQQVSNWWLCLYSHQLHTRVAHSSHTLAPRSPGPVPGCRVCRHTAQHRSLVAAAVGHVRPQRRTYRVVVRLTQEHFEVRDPNSVRGTGGKRTSCQCDLSRHPRRRGGARRDLNQPQSSGPKDWDGADGGCVGRGHRGGVCRATPRQPHPEAEVLRPTERSQSIMAPAAVEGHAAPWANRQAHGTAAVGKGGEASCMLAAHALAGR